MEAAGSLSPRHNTDTVPLNEDDNDDPERQSFEVESSSPTSRSDRHFHSTSALEILRESVRILRYDSWGFMAIALFFICPVSAVLLTNVAVDQSIVKKLTIRLLLIAKSSGLPLNLFIKQIFRKFCEIIISDAMCFPLFVTLSLLSEAAVAHAVDCTYSRNNFDSSKFYQMIKKIWRRILVTYLWVCILIVGCLVLFLVLLLLVTRLFFTIGLPSDLIMYPFILVGIAFSIIVVNLVVICNIAVVISVLEDVSGPQALLRSTLLIRGQIQVGILIFLGSTISKAFVEGLFGHRVRTISYGDGSSRIWEGPLLVLMYSFVVLVDSMATAVFYFSCKSFSMDTSKGETQPVLEAMTMSPRSEGLQ